MAEGYEKAPYELREQFSFVNMPTGWSVTYSNNFVVGKIVFVGGLFRSDTVSTAKQFNFANVIPEEYGFTGKRICFSGFNNATDKSLHGILTGNGFIFYRPETENLTDIEFSVSYAIE